MFLQCILVKILQVSSDIHPFFKIFFLLKLKLKMLFYPIFVYAEYYIVSYGLMFHSIFDALITNLS